MRSSIPRENCRQHPFVYYRERKLRAGYNSTLLHTSTFNDVSLKQQSNANMKLYSLAFSLAALLHVSSALPAPEGVQPTPPITPIPDTPTFVPGPTITAPPGTPCYTYTTTKQPTTCPPLDCMELMCISLSTVTMPCPTVTCPITPTETEWQPCRTTCRTGCATGVTAVVESVCPR
ncbi:hypothetical protein VTO42DRAFT_6091 [Malbranchea cinnamomea]